MMCSTLIQKSGSLSSQLEFLLEGPSTWISLWGSRSSPTNPWIVEKLKNFKSVLLLLWICDFHKDKPHRPGSIHERAAVVCFSFPPSSPF